MKIVTKAYAKINLFLDIIGTMPGGYHELCTVMQQIDLADEVELTVTAGDHVSVICDNPAISSSGGNIAYKAARLYLETMGERKAVDISIKKNIPLEAGLGGSSTDGAAVLSALNGYFGDKLSLAELCSLGAVLGADVPFCLVGGTRLCTGTGTETIRLAPLSGWEFVVAKPAFSHSTAAAYRLYDDCPIMPSPDFKSFISGLRSHNYPACFSLMYNIFEEIYSDQRIFELKSRLKSLGAEAALMTGSGSAVFGVFREAPGLDVLRGELPGCEVFVARPVG